MRWSPPGGGPSYLLHVLTLGLACCAVECVAAATVRTQAPGGGSLRAHAAPGEPAVHVLVVAGTVTDALAPAVLASWALLPEPKRVISFGACSNSGGPYWDSYSVTKGSDQLVPVDAYVPGCPPRPEALLHGLRLLHEGTTG